MLVARILFRPSGAWALVRATDARWTRTLFGYALPLSLVPAIAWPLGRDEPLATGAPAVLLVCLASVLLLALAFLVLSGTFGVARSWNRSLALAAYGSTPLLLGLPLLLSPMLAVLGIAALLHAFALCYLGAHQVLGCRESEAALFVASAWTASVMAGMLLGGLCSAAGWL